jgi:hypothetical protein
MMDLPSLPEASVRPLGENATVLTGQVWPVSVRNSWPLAASQSLMDLSSLPEASVRPSGENATDSTSPV